MARGDVLYSLVLLARDDTFDDFTFAAHETRATGVGIVLLPVCVAKLLVLLVGNRTHLSALRSGSGWRWLGGSRRCCGLEFGRQNGGRDRKRFLLGFGFLLFLCLLMLVFLSLALFLFSLLFFALVFSFLVVFRVWRILSSFLVCCNAAHSFVRQRNETRV